MNRPPVLQAKNWPRMDADERGLKHRELTESIIGIFYDVYNELGFGFLATTPDRVHEAQLLNYLRCTNVEVGLLLNFGPKPVFRRMAFSNERKEIRVDPR